MILMCSGEMLNVITLHMWLHGYRAPYKDFFNTGPLHASIFKGIKTLL